MRIVVLVLGLLLTLWAIIGVIRSMLVQTNSLSVVDVVANKVVTGISYRVLGLLPSFKSQNRWLSFLGPVVILVRLLTYVVILIITTGLIVFGTTNLSFIESLYQSGATLTTLGITEQVNFFSTITVFFAAFLGLVLIAVFIGYLMGLYGAVVNRESPMARLSALAGEPAWGPQILARAHALKLPSEQAPIVLDWLNWISDLRLNQRSNPVQAEFRSTSELRHWVISMLAVMDAVALRIAFTGKDMPQDVQLLTEGSITFSLFDDPGTRVRNWDLMCEFKQAIALDQGGPIADRKIDAAELSDADWEAGLNALSAVGYPMPDDLEVTRQRFLRIRSIYATQAYRLAWRYHSVRAPWSGARRTNLEVQWPEIAREVEAAS